MTLTNGDTASSFAGTAQFDGLTWSGFDGLTVTGAATLSTAAVTLNSNGGNILFSSTLAGGSQNLTVAAGTAAGTTTFTGAVSGLGSGTGAAFTAASTGLVRFMDTVGGASGLVSTSGSGATRFDGDVTLTDGDTASSFAGTAQFDGLTWSGFDGLTVTGAATLSTAAVTLNSNGGNILFSSTLAGGSQNLTVAAGTAAGTTTFTGAVSGLGSGTGAAFTAASTGLVRFMDTVGAASGLVSTSGSGATRFDGDVTLTNGDTASSFAGTAQFDGLTWSGFDGLTVTGAATLSTAAVTLNSNGGNILFSSTLAGGSQNLTVAAGTAAGTTTFTGAVSGLGSGTGAAFTAASTGLVRFMDTVGAASGLVSTNGSGATRFDGDVTLTDGDTASSFAGTAQFDGLTWSGFDGLTVTGAATLSTAAVTLNSNGGNILFSSTLAGGSQNLTVAAGTAAGTTTFTGAVSGLGSGTGAAFTAASTGLVRFMDTVGAASGLVSTSGSGATRFDGDVTLTNGDTASSFAGTAQFDGLTWSGFDGLTVTGAATLSTAAVTLNSNGGNILFSSTLAGGQGLTATAGAGNITFTGVVGGTALGAVTLNSTGTTAISSAFTAASLTTNAGGTTTINGNLTTTGTQTYNDAVRIDSGLTLATTNSAVAFASTLDSQASEANNLAINTGSGAVTFGGTIGGAVGGAFGTLTINNTSGSGVALPTVTAQTLNITTAGAITDTGVLTVAGTTTLAAGSANDITLNNANNFGTVTVTSGNNVTLVDTGALALGASTVSGALTLTAGSHITQSGVLNVTGITTIGVTSSGTDILLGSFANNLGTTVPVLSGTVGNIRDLNIRNVNAGAKMPVIAPSTASWTGLTGLQNLTLNFDAAPIALPGLTASGTMTITAGGTITDSGPSVVPGLSVFNSGAFNIELNDPGNNFGTVQLAGAAITLFNVSSINLAGVQASSSFNLQNGGDLTVSSAITSGSAITLGSTGGSLILNAAVSASSGSLTLTAAQNVTASSAGAISTGSGAITVEAGGTAQLANITSGGGNVTVTSNGASFISPLTISGAFLVKSGGGVSFGQALTGGGNLTVNSTGASSFSGPISGLSSLTVNTAGITTFSGSISGLGSLITDAGGSTVLAGGSLGVTGSFRFGDPVLLSNSLTITGPTGRFNDTLRGASDGGQTLTLNLSGDTIFVGAVGGGGQRLGSLTTDGAGRTLFYGGSVLTTGAQAYNEAVLLGANTIMGASALTFNSSLNTGPSLISLAPLASGATVDAAVTGESDLTANVSGATVFNAPVGQTSRIGDVTTDAAGTTSIRANFNATRITLNDPVTFDTAPAITVDTTGAQLYAATATLGTNLTFNSTLSAVFSPATGNPEGIRFAQGLSAAGRIVTITAPQSTVSSGGDIGGVDARLQTLSAAGRYMVIGGDVWAQGDIALGIGTGTTGENDFLQFTGPAGATRSTFVDSLEGEIILGSGATGNTDKTGAPGRASIFKTNDGDLYLFARKVTVQPFERLVVRNGSLIAIADGTADDDGITLSSTAASNYLVLVSSTGTTGQRVPGINIHSRGPASVDLADGSTTQDQGTDLIAGAIYFFNSTFGSDIPTRETYAPVPATENTFNYQLFTGNILSAFGPLAINILPDGGGVVQNVYVADMVLTNRFRPVLGGLIYLDLSTAPGFSPGRTINGLGPFIDPNVGLLGLTDVLPLRTLVSSNAAPRTVLQSAFTPNVPREDNETAPPEVDLAPAVREQLQALGIYARALRPAERISRERRMGLFTTIPERERPRESDYEVADARVENRAVREVLRLATEAGLIGEDQNKLDEVARALAASYETFSVLSLNQEAKDFRAWLEASTEPDPVRVLEYVKTLHETLKGIELLGLTRQELASSKAQIYGSILRARLNAEPEFLRSLVEDTAAPAQVSAVGSPAVSPGALAQTALR